MFDKIFDFEELFLVLKVVGLHHRGLMQKGSPNLQAVDYNLNNGMVIGISVSGNRKWRSF